MNSVLGALVSITGKPSFLATYPIFSLTLGAYCHLTVGENLRPFLTLKIKLCTRKDNQNIKMQMWLLKLKVNCRMFRLQSYWLTCVLLGTIMVDVLKNQSTPCKQV